MMIYLDNAATTYRKPDCVIRAVAEALGGLGNAGRGVNDASLDAARLFFETRQLLSELFGGYGAGQTAFTANSTEALNIAVHGLINAGDHVVATCLEHNSVLRPLYAACEAGAKLTIVRPQKLSTVAEDVIRAIRPDTKAVFCTHASNLTGDLVDITKIGEACRARGILFIVDASQTAGVFPIDMRKMCIDVLCVTGHKSLMGPQGTGAILVREGLVIRPLKTGGTGVRTYEKRQPAEMPTLLEAGTQNGHGIAGLRAAVSYLNATGAQTIRSHELSLARRFYEGIRDVNGIRVYGDMDVQQRAPIVLINLDDTDSGLVSDALYAEYGIQTRAGGHCAPLMHEYLGTLGQGAVRFSFGWFNTETEVDLAIRAVKELAEQS